MHKSLVIECYDNVFHGGSLMLVRVPFRTIEGAMDGFSTQLMFLVKMTAEAS